MQVFYGLFTLWKDGSALRGSGEKGRCPVLGTVAGESAMIGKHHKGRQVIVEGTECPCDPRTHTRKAWPVEAGGLQIGGLAVNAGLSGHVMNECDIVDDGTERFNDFAEELAALAVGTESERRLHPRSEAILEGFDFFAEAGGFAMMLFERRFVIPEVQVTGGPAHKQLDDSANFRWIMEHLEGAARTDLSGRRESVIRCGDGGWGGFLGSEGFVFEQHY